MSNMPPTLGNLAFLGGYAPRRCGIATFTTDLHQAVAAASPKSDCFVVAVTDHLQTYSYGSGVRFELEERDAGSYRRTADSLNLAGVDVLSLQHEFGIFGGPSGSYLLGLLREVQVPVVTTLHTILSTPDTAQRKVMDEIVRRSDRLIVMAHRGKEILCETYDVDPDQIDVIPHGIPDVPFATSPAFKHQLGLDDRVMMLTFGLLGPGKGIEHAIRALPAIVAKHPEVVYVILGATHPHLLAHEGEHYRLGLERLAEEHGVKDHVIFHNRFVTQDDLSEFITAADIYLSPYPNEAQITSGTLAQAFGAGTAVVSTPYWHAQELLTDGRGILVSARDHEALSAGVINLLNDPEGMLAMRKRAYANGRSMIWSEVARLYLASFAKAKANRSYVPRAAFSKSTMGINQYLHTFPNHRKAQEVRQTLVERLLSLWDQNSEDGWLWFENSLSYDNARISQALIECGRLMPHPAASGAGIQSLSWLSSLTTVTPGHFRPIGSDGFYTKGGTQAAFDQQPLEAQAMVAACLAAWRATAEPVWQREARRAFEWFLGRNDLGLPLYDSRTGGCCDGLHPDRVNSNQGAESTLAFMISLVEMQQAELEWTRPAVIPQIATPRTRGPKPVAEMQPA